MKTFDGDSFYAKEIKHFVKWQNQYQKIKLETSSKRELKKLRSRISGYMDTHNVIIESEKVNERTLIIKNTGSYER